MKVLSDEFVENVGESLINADNYEKVFLLASIGHLCIAGKKSWSDYSKKVGQIIAPKRQLQARGLRSNCWQTSSCHSLKLQKLPQKNAIDSQDQYSLHVGLQILFKKM